MMRPNTGLHADQAWRHIGKPGFDLAAQPLLAQHNCAALIQADHMEGVLAERQKSNCWDVACCLWRACNLNR